VSVWVGWGFEGLGGVEWARFPHPVQISQTLLSHRPDAGERHADLERSISGWGNASVPEKAPDKPRRESSQDPEAKQGKADAECQGTLSCLAYAGIEIASALRASQ